MFASLGDRAVSKGGVRALEKRTRPDIHGIPAGALATSAECGDGVRYQSDSDESDSDDN